MDLATSCFRLRSDSIRIRRVGRSVHTQSRTGARPGHVQLACELAVFPLAFDKLADRFMFRAEQSRGKTGPCPDREINLDCCPSTTVRRRAIVQRVTAQPG